MRARCANPKTVNYARYGGRGIGVCEAWTDFKIFLADMGHAPGRTTIDRIDNNGPYSPENCRWATRKEQSNNTSRNRYLKHQGETLTVTQWAEKLGISSSTALGRYKLGWDSDKILSPDSQQDYTGLFLGGINSAIKRKAKPFCKYGHERTPENVYVQIKDGKEIRKYCKKCGVIRMAAWRKQRKS